MKHLSDGQLLTLYSDLMVEIKKRVEILDTLEKFPVPMPVGPLKEFYYLQIRFICELVALGCVAAHGRSVANKSKLLKEWNAGKVIKIMADLHPDFYPKPARIFEGAGTRIEEVLDGDYLTRDQFMKIYNTCGDKLHRGRMATLSKKLKTTPDLSDVIMWKRRIINLLNCHIIQLVNPNHFIAVVMHRHDTGEPHCWLFEAVQLNMGHPAAN